MKKRKEQKISRADKQEWMLGLCILILTVLIVLNLKDEYQAAEVKTKKRPYTVVVDPGHGGKDPGKISARGVQEKNLNLQVSKKLKKELEKAGMKVKLTREEDTTATGKPESGKGEDMNARIGTINDEMVDICVSIHMNSYPSANVSGAQVFYYQNSTSGEKLAKKIQDILVQDVDRNNNRREKSDNSYYILVHSSCPTVIVECGFLSSIEEEAKLKSEEYQWRLAKAITKGITNYFSP